MAVIVSDTSPLFYLSSIGRLRLLRELYGSVVVPERVWAEVLAAEEVFPGVANALKESHGQGWINVVPVSSPANPLLAALDPGEADAIMLAFELGAVLLIIDEKLGRETASRMGLSVCGTLGVLVAAKRQGLISLIAPDLQRLRLETSFRFTPELEQFVLSEVGELPL
jgi:predicted nucleic acid-binding protein